MKFTVRLAVREILFMIPEHGLASTPHVCSVALIGNPGTGVGSEPPDHNLCHAPSAL